MATSGTPTASLRRGAAVGAAACQCRPGLQAVQAAARAGRGQVPTIPPGSNGRAALSAGTSGLNRVQQYAADGPGSLGELMGARREASAAERRRAAHRPRGDRGRLQVRRRLRPPAPRIAGRRGQLLRGDRGFQDILNVVPKSPVMVDDVTVGEVTDVERVGWHAKLTMRIKNDVDLPDDAIADIRQVSLLGEKHVALEAPAGGERAGSPTATTSRSRTPAATRRSRRCSGALSFLLSGGGVGQLGTITHELNAVMDGAPTGCATCSAPRGRRRHDRRRRTTSSARWTRSTTSPPRSTPRSTRSPAPSTSPVPPSRCWLPSTTS